MKIGTYSPQTSETPPHLMASFAEPPRPTASSVMPARCQACGILRLVLTDSTSEKSNKKFLRRFQAAELPLQFANPLFAGQHLPLVFRYSCCIDGFASQVLVVCSARREGGQDSGRINSCLQSPLFLLNRSNGGFITLETDLSRSRSVCSSRSAERT